MVSPSFFRSTLLVCVMTIVVVNFVANLEAIKQLISSISTRKELWRTTPVMLSGTEKLVKAETNAAVLPVQCDQVLQEHKIQIRTAGLQDKKAASVNIGQMSSPDDVPYLVSFSWWDRRLNQPAFAERRPLPSNPSVDTIQKLLRNTTADASFVDVGANVGFMTNYAMALGRKVYAVEPISYDIVKLCEGIQANIEKGYIQTDVDETYRLFHAAAGAQFTPQISVTRPSDRIGYFDQSSLSRDAVLQTDVVEEIIPLIQVDSIVPADVSVGVVKIDVQGHEYGVLIGMRDILSRKSGFPKYIFYEDNPNLTRKAGFQPGACAQLLRVFGYVCKRSGGDTLCYKFE